uniref:Uncharacterized protein n=1 Tax=Timema tahoe TaxID=61484 RepID=A0A7R9IRL7_9NEOP|nr:unnamed protein product [Timema tahoe]
MALSYSYTIVEPSKVRVYRVPTSKPVGEQLTRRLITFRLVPGDDLEAPVQSHVRVDGGEYLPREIFGVFEVGQGQFVPNQPEDDPQEEKPLNNATFINSREGDTGWNQYDTKITRDTEIITTHTARSACEEPYLTDVKPSACDLSHIINIQHLEQLYNYKTIAKQICGSVVRGTTGYVAQWIGRPTAYSRHNKSVMG